ncbi:GGDEF domain-containing protein [Lampropedia puyangensis]|uniref:diguanylate cyclase n=1 Tax=Lampropedia puyangensis TaxID=1330072 RepID=A0A4S8F4Y6_9BURK|nr:GGDEF domain-containing protein [Lampropedia puyangensis]
MAPILQDLARMTGQRNHLRLEISVVTTLSRLPRVLDVTMMDLLQEKGIDYVLVKHHESGQGDQDCPHYAAGKKLEEMLPLAQYSHVRQAILENRGHAVATWQDGVHQGHCIWLIVWHQQQAMQCIELRQLEPFDAARIELITSVFQVYQNYHDLLDYSERDSLTGLYNRKTFDDLRFKSVNAIPLSPQARAAAQRRHSDQDQLACESSQRALSDWLAIIDIDNFKQINDQFGHLYGDEVLILVANLLRQNFRNTDRVFRYGGEEFVVLLRAADQATAVGVLERLRLSVEGFRFPQVGLVTVSIGFSHAGNFMLADLLDQADRALYYVKRNGKNQVAYYQELLASGKVHGPVQNSEVDLF